MAKGAKTGGRKKGTPNKTTASVKAAIAAAFDEVGGSAYLVRIAEENPVAFCTLIGKLLPLQHTGDEDQPIKHVFTWQS